MLPKLRQPLFSLVNTLLYLLLGLYFVIVARSEFPLTLGSATFPTEAMYGLAGLMFLMAYFALAHLKACHER